MQKVKIFCFELCTYVSKKKFFDKKITVQEKGESNTLILLYCMQKIQFRGKY